MSEEKQYSDDVKKAYDRILDAHDALVLQGVTILTGSNGSGKSLIRTQIPFKFRDEFKIEDTNKLGKIVKSCSMTTRTASNPEMGALSSMMHDVSWIATSQNTLSLINSLIDSTIESGMKEESHYLVFDEFEIGCGEEVVLSIVNLFNEKFPEIIKNTSIIGIMVITHNRNAVKVLDHDNFINIEGMTKDEWVNREVIPADLKKLDDNELFSYINNKL